MRIIYIRVRIHDTARRRHSIRYSRRAEEQIYDEVDPSVPGIGATGNISYSKIHYLRIMRLGYASAYTRARTHVGIHSGIRPAANTLYYPERSLFHAAQDTN